MKRYQIIMSLYVIIVGGTVFIFFRDVFEKNPAALKFEEYQFNDSIDDIGINYNYYFKIGDKTYYQDTDTMFVYYPKNREEVLLLYKEELWYPEELIHRKLMWRSVTPPFRLIKEKDSDTLTIIKKGKKFLFVKEVFVKEGMDK